MGTILRVLFLTLIAGCYPDLDWREVRSDEGGFTVLLPAKPRFETQSLPSQGAQLQLRQWSSKARQTAFAIGYVDLPPEGSDALAVMREALLRNISGKTISDNPVTIDGLPGRDILAEGRVGDSAVVLRLRSITGKKRLYNLAVLGPPEDFQPSEIETFFMSLNVEKAKP